MTELQPGSVSVPARGGFVLGNVVAGSTWCFRAKGRWWDFFVPSGPEGYRFFLADVLDIYPIAKGRPFFELIARVQGFPETLYPIGRGATITFRDSGPLELFPNDAAGFESNNRGAITVDLHPCDGPPTEPDPARYHGLSGMWRLLRDTVERTKGVTSTAVLTVGACAALAFVQQGRDLVRTVAEGVDWPRQLAFAAMLLFLAVQAWFWPRMIIMSNYGRDPSDWRPRPLLEWGPRVLGLAPFLLALWAVVRNPAPATLLIALLVGVGLVFFVVIIVQRDVRRKLRQRRAARQGGPEQPPFRIGRWWVLFSLLAAAASMAAAAAAPAAFGLTLGAPAVVFLGIACIIPVLVVLVQTGAAARVPMLLGLAVWASFWALLGLDNHPVGWRAPRTVMMDAPPRLDLARAYDLWAAQAPPGADGKRTMVLAASEGGASRAGYWTAEVLAALHRETGGELARRLFAISSVSGGSVGAVGYAATLQARPGLAPGALHAPLTDFAGRDFLSPTLGGMLFPDLFQRFVPVAFLPDRAQGLELAFEHGWAEHCKSFPGCTSEGLFRQGFSALAPAPNAPWRPVLIVNGASEETGRRILTSPVRFAPSEVDADDFYDLTGRDVPVSTAIHNGARFPWVSPAGTLTRREGQPRGHIVDGGYFEAAGVEVIRELAPAVRAIAASRGHQLRLVVVFIGYTGATDEARPSEQANADLRAGALPRANAPATHRLFNEILAPLMAVFQSRTGHAAHLMRELKVNLSGDPSDIDPTVHVSTAEVHYEPVLLCRQPGKRGSQAEFEPPMDWALSACARAYMGEAAGISPTPQQAAVCKTILSGEPACQNAAPAAIRRAARQILGAEPEPRS